MEQKCFPLYNFLNSFIKSISMAKLEIWLLSSTLWFLWMFRYIHSSNCSALNIFKNMCKEQHPNIYPILIWCILLSLLFVSKYWRFQFAPFGQLKASCVCIPLFSEPKAHSYILGNFHIDIYFSNIIVICFFVDFNFGLLTLFLQYFGQNTPWNKIIDIFHNCINWVWSKCSYFWMYLRRTPSNKKRQSVNSFLRHTTIFKNYLMKINACFKLL